MSTLAELDKQIANLHKQLVALSAARKEIPLADETHLGYNEVERNAVVTVLVKRLKARTKLVGESRKWWFTFTLGDATYGGGCYAVFEGTYKEAREKMGERFGDKWAFQYESAEAAGVEEWSLREVMKRADL